MTHFINRDLRNRSFKRKNFALTNFRGADIRGCNFAGAVLSSSDFSDVKAGLSLRQKCCLGIWTIAVSLFAGDVMSRLIFNTIGQPPLDFRTPHVPVLYAIVSLAGISSAIAAIYLKTRIGRISTIVTSVLMGVTLAFGIGFFYPGLLLYLVFPSGRSIPESLDWLHQILSFSQERDVAISAVTAVLGIAIMLLLSRFQSRTSFKVGASVLGAIASYVAAFFWSTIANACFGNQNLIFGTIFGVVSIIYLILTLISLNRIVYELQNAIGTSFRGAELTHATFDYADLRNTDFSGAIGFSPLKLK
jgi:uncharacterized protein YjbI with pentapeptide repeats